MSRAFVTQPSTAYCGQTGMAFGALSNSSKCLANNGSKFFHATSPGLCRPSRHQLGHCYSASQALSYREPNSKSSRKLNSRRLDVIGSAGSGSSDCNRNINKSPARRLQVVSHAAPLALRSGTGTLILPLSIMDSDREDPDVDSNVYNQLLIQKQRAEPQNFPEKVAFEKERLDQFGETESEVAVTATRLRPISSSSEDVYESTLKDLIDQLEGVRLHALALERRHAPELKKVHRQYVASARNLLHYVAFRSLDIADLQARLASTGLSSLEGCEAHTLASLNSISSILCSLLHGSQASRLCCSDKNKFNNSFPSPSISRRQPNKIHSALEAHDDVLLNTVESDTVSFEVGNALLSHHAEMLLGPSPPKRKTVVMVTLPSEAAEDDALIQDLFNYGMNIARINCAHDSPEVWKKMVRKVRFFSQLLEIPCRISFDLAGPKLRTGPMQPGPSVLKIKPALKDSLGDVVTPACVWIAPEGTKPSDERIPDAIIPIIPSRRWTKKVQIGDAIKFKDARGRSRGLHVVAKGSNGGIFAECRSVAYIHSGCEFRIFNQKNLKCKVSQLPEVEQVIVLRTGDQLLLKREPMLGSPGKIDETGKLIHPASVTCTLEKVFDVAKRGEPVKFDDGKISGVISSVSEREICVDITEAGDAAKGRKLKGEKAINFPASDLSSNGLTLKDKTDLDFVVANADILALSFVNGPADVRALQEELEKRGAEKLGIVVKIETEMGVRRLPEILLQMMEGVNPVGVMVARGDMAVECGWERLAEIQDQILVVCESAHVPCVWATQVLEGLAKSGLPSRAEITDAASGSRAECVMLNKGPYIVQAVASLDDILCREACRRRKNQSVLRPLPDLPNLGMQGS